MRWQPLRALVLALAAGAGTAIALGAHAATSSPQAGSTTTLQTTTFAPPPTTTRSTTTTAPPPTTTQSTTVTFPASHLIPWPGGSGWTDVLESVPARGGHAEAVDEANRAIRAGLANVGVLLSSRYRSLHPGYWVVFAGAFGTLAGAQAEAAQARARGFSAAYPRYIRDS